MNFDLSEEHKLIRDTARCITEERVAPRAAVIDETGQYPEDIFEAFKEQGLLGISQPVEYGGSGIGMLGLGLAIEEVAKHCCASGLILLLSAFTTRPILIAGNERQKTDYVVAVARGERRGAFCLTEANAGSDVAGIQSRARRSDTGYILNGEKCFISGTTVADYFVYFAKTDTDAGVKGISAFLVPRNAPGVSLGQVDRKMGVEGVPSTHPLLEECRLPEESLLGREGEGFKIAMLSLNSCRPLVGARGLGLAEGALRYSLEYARNRQAFGQTISSSQALQFMMADMVMQIEAARLLVYQGACLVDQGKFGKKYAPLLSTAKCFATEMAIKVSSDALQFLGGHGYMKEHPLERMYRDARQLTLVEGTSQMQKTTIANGLLDGDISY
ncbi:acyl-CoA dehydrogenase family protein [Chloroflexota bacterium]